MFSTHVIAIDEGREATRALWLKGSPGNLEVVRTVSLDGDDRSLGAVVRELKTHKGPVRGIALGLRGSVANLRYNLVPPVPDWRLELIMKYELEEMIEKSGEPLSSDWQQLEVPESRGDDLVLLVGLGKDGHIQPSIDAIEAAGGRVNLATPNAVALYHAYRQSLAGVPQETVLLADLGSQDSHVAIVCEGRLVFARTVSYGGQQMDDNLASALSLDVEQAAKLKKKLSKGSLPNHLVESAQPALRSSFGQLVSMLQSSITFCRAQTKTPDFAVDRVLLSGGLTRIPGLREYLEEGLSRPVEIHRPAVSGELVDPEKWVTAIGIAASSLDPQRFGLDLLPAEAKAKRQYRERTVFLQGAAVVLALALLVQIVGSLKAHWTLDGWKETVASNRNQVETWQREKEKAKAKNKKFKAQIDRLQAEAENTAFVGRLFQALQSITPVGIALESIESKRETADGEAYVVMTLAGRSDNSQQTALDELERFEDALRAVPGVRWVKPGGVEDPRDGAVAFVMLLSAHEEMPQGRSGDKRRRGRRG